VLDLHAVVVNGETVVSADHIAIRAAEGTAVEAIVAAVLVDRSYYLFLVTRIFITNRNV
jgi:hypothetical protein